MISSESPQPKVTKTFTTHYLEMRASATNKNLAECKTVDPYRDLRPHTLKSYGWMTNWEQRVKPVWATSKRSLPGLFFSFLPLLLHRLHQIFLCAWWTTPFMKGLVPGDNFFFLVGWAWIKIPIYRCQHKKKLSAIRNSNDGTWKQLTVFKE